MMCTRSESESARFAGHICVLHLPTARLWRPWTRTGAIRLPEVPLASDATLRVLTFDPEQPDNLVVLDGITPCTDQYDCPCPACKLDRARRIKRGVRPSQPLPFKRKAA